MDVECRYLFVYGTLRPGCDHPMARFLADRARLVGPGRVNGRLFRCGWYPALLSAEHPDDWVHGDLFHMTDADETLAELDHYENDASDLFERSEVLVIRDCGERCTAWVYFYHGQVDPTKRIASGDYLRAD